MILVARRAAALGLGGHQGRSRWPVAGRPARAGRDAGRGAAPRVRRAGARSTRGGRASRGASADGDVDAVARRARGSASRTTPDDELVASCRRATARCAAAAALPQAGVEPGAARSGARPAAAAGRDARAGRPGRDAKRGLRLRRRAPALRPAPRLRLSGSRPAWWRRRPRASSRCCWRRSGPRTCWPARSSGIGLLGLGQLAAHRRGRRSRRRRAVGALEVDGDVLVAAGSRSCGSCSATRSTPARSRAPARSCRARRSSSPSIDAADDADPRSRSSSPSPCIDNPDGTLATGRRRSSRSAAPMTMPPRIALGEASALEVVAALAVTAGGRRAADPAGGADLQRRGPAHRLRGQAARRLAQRARLTARPEPPCGRQRARRAQALACGARPGGRDVRLGGASRRRARRPSPPARPRATRAREPELGHGRSASAAGPSDALPRLDLRAPPSPPGHRPRPARARRAAPRRTRCGEQRPRPGSCARTARPSRRGSRAPCRSPSWRRVSCA